MSKNDKIYPGFYKSWAGKTVYVIGVFPNYDTKENVVVFREEHYAGAKYYTLSPQEFLQSKVKENGKILPRFSRNDFFYKPPKDDLTTELQDKGFSSTRTLGFRIYSSYEEYAKILLKNFAEDMKFLNNCLDRVEYNFSKKEWKYFAEEMQFCERCLKGDLHKYWNFTEEHYIHKVSLRKYAEKHNLNRGSVEHLNKMLIKEFAHCLAKRDIEEKFFRVE